MGSLRLCRGGALLVAGVLGCTPLTEGEGEGGTDETSSSGPSGTGLSTSGGSMPATTSQGVTSESSDTTADPDTTATTEQTGDDETSSIDPDTGSSTSGSTGESRGESSSSTGDERPDERRVFLSSQTFTGNLGGALGADGECQDLADAAALGGEWRAYIIDPGNSLSRHTQDDRPIVRLDGVLVADDWDDLTDGSIQATIHLDENEEERSGNAWTGFYDVGGAPDNWCDDWTFEGGDCLANGVCGSAGESSMTDTHWDGFYIFNCSDQFRLYCVEQ